MNRWEISGRTQHFTVGELAHFIDIRTVVLERKFKTVEKSPWTKRKKASFIESLICKIDPPSFYFDGAEQPWTIIDGRERVKAISEFLRDEIPLTGMKFLKEYEGLAFSGLPLYERQKLLTIKLKGSIINPHVPTEIRREIFKRIRNN